MANLLGAEATDRTSDSVSISVEPREMESPPSSHLAHRVRERSVPRRPALVRLERILGFGFIKTVRLSGIPPPGVTKQLPILWASLMHSPTKFSVFHYEEGSSRGPSATVGSSFPDRRGLARPPAARSTADLHSTRATSRLDLFVCNLGTGQWRRALPALRLLIILTSAPAIPAVALFHRTKRGNAATESRADDHHVIVEASHQVPPSSSMQTRGPRSRLEHQPTSSDPAFGMNAANYVPLLFVQIRRCRVVSSGCLSFGLAVSESNSWIHRPEF